MVLIDKDFSYGISKIMQRPVDHDLFGHAAQILITHRSTDQRPCSPGCFRITRLQTETIDRRSRHATLDDSERIQIVEFGISQHDPKVIPHAINV